MRISSEAPVEEISLQDIYDRLQEQHRNIFFYQIGEQVFICRSLGRLEFKNIINNEELNDMDREEVICEMCTLFPEKYDFSECDAGIPTNLTKNIIIRSGLDSIEKRVNIMNYYRAEMSDVDHQITVMINEAFPNIDIEEIETWDIEKTAKYLSRAEWKLVHLRGMDINYDPFEEGEEEVTTEELGKEEEVNREEETNMKGGAKEKMTPEKLAELRAKYPEINWGSDSAMTDGIDGLKDGMDTVAPALRPGS